MERIIDGRGRLALVPVGPSEARVVQGVNELRADAVDQLHHGLRLRQDVVEVESFVIHRKCPIYLGGSRRAEEMAGVRIDSEGSLQPPLILDQTVRVPCLDNVPGIPQSFPQGGVLRQTAGEVFQEHSADGFIGVRTPKQQCVALAPANLQAQQRPVLPGSAHLKEGDALRVLPCQTAGAVIQLRCCQEFPIVWNFRQQLLKHPVHIPHFPHNYLISQLIPSRTVSESPAVYRSLI